MNWQTGPVPETVDFDERRTFLLWLNHDNMPWLTGWIGPGEWSFDSWVTPQDIAKWVVIHDGKFLSI